MRKYNYTKDELNLVANKVYLNELQVKLIEYRQLDYSLIKISELVNCSIRKISNEFLKIDKKLKKLDIK